MKTKERTTHQETVGARVLAAHKFNDERTVGFQIYRPKRPKDNIGWLVGALFLLFGVVLSAGRLTVIGQFLDDALFNLPWGWMKFPLYFTLLVVAAAIYFNYHFKFKTSFIVMISVVFCLLSWMLSLAILTYLYDTQLTPYDLGINRLWDREVFNKAFKLYWLNWKDYSIFGATYAQATKLDFLFRPEGYASLYGAGGAIGYLLASASYYLSLPGAYILYSCLLAITGTWILTGDPLYFTKRKADRHGRALRLLPLAKKNNPYKTNSPLIATKVTKATAAAEYDQFLSEDLLTLQGFDDDVSLKSRQTTVPSTTTSFDDEETLIPSTADLLTVPLEETIPTPPEPTTKSKSVFASTMLQTNLNQKVVPHFQSRRSPISPNKQVAKNSINDIPLAKLQQKRNHNTPGPQATRQAQSAIYNRLDPQEARRLFERETSVTPFGKVNKTAIFKEVFWPNYELPPLTLLDANPSQALDRQYNQNYASQVVNLLNQWLLAKQWDAQCQLVVIGEAVSRYQFVCGPNLSPLTIRVFEEELKSLIRVDSWRWDYNPQAPNPLIFELPNHTSLKVSLREVLQGIPPAKRDYPLLFALGKRVSGELLTANLVNMPHILLAGQEGSGKSTVLSNLITSLLLRNNPHQVKLVLIDSPTKKLINFARLPHLLTPYITNGHHVYPTFQKLIKLLEQRDQLFNAMKVRTLRDYNQQQKVVSQLPYVVIIINELQDLRQNPDWQLIAPQLRQLMESGHLVGIHLVIASANPETVLVDEFLKRNCPTRLALKLASPLASQAILGQGGAEQLSRPGDLLFAYQGAAKLIRAQAVYLDPSELKKILTFIYQQTNKTPQGES